MRDWLAHLCQSKSLYKHSMMLVSGDHQDHQDHRWQFRSNLERRRRRNSETVVRLFVWRPWGAWSCYTLQVSLTQINWHLSAQPLMSQRSSSLPQRSSGPILFQSLLPMTTVLLFLYYFSLYYSLWICKMSISLMSNSLNILFIGLCLSLFMMLQGCFFVSFLLVL